MHLINPFFFYFDRLFVSVSVCCVCVYIGLMSRVQALRDHRGKDCRFLSFRRGDTIFVYHKLTGKREDLWAGTVCLMSPFFLTCFCLLSLKQNIINNPFYLNSTSSQVRG